MSLRDSFWSSGCSVVEGKGSGGRKLGLPFGEILWQNQRGGGPAVLLDRVGSRRNKKMSQCRALSHGL